MVKSVTPQRIAEWDKTTISSAQAVPAAGSASWVDLRTTGLVRRDGVTTKYSARFPELDQYDGLRVSFGVPTFAGTATGTIELLAIDGDDNVQSVGFSTYAAGLFPPIEVPLYGGVKYYARVTAAGSALTITIFAAPFYQALPS